MMRPGVVWFGPDCRLYVRFVDVWRASVDAVWCVCVYGRNRTDCCSGWVGGAGWVSEEPRAQVTRACMLLIAIVGLLGLLCTCFADVAALCNQRMRGMACARNLDTPDVFLPSMRGHRCLSMGVGAGCGLLNGWVGSDLI